MRYQSGRYIIISEAVWRILPFPIHERYPPVFHLENERSVYFVSDNVRERVENPRNTTLMAFFKLCQEENFAKTLLYEDVPSYYTFDKQCGLVNRRKRGIQIDEYPGICKENAIGRVFTVHLNNSECYYLRLLLYNVRGPTSFKDLTSVDGVAYPSYQAACRALHLLEDDAHR